ncbi:hypothetical protein JG688_00013440 [Phytophthora aleatoria]|uniref:histone acetyltransferase n=1 Tax=Phytophthora aleatoria TaxID=2496075 RepID=A0A8J5J1P3_9STRA|nr:hypothetical protein JG688_00013440 [Phytophthora aleatoria]
MGLNTRALSCERGKTSAASKRQAFEQPAPTLEPSGGGLATPAPADATVTPHGVKRALGAAPTCAPSDKKLKLEVKEGSPCGQETEGENTGTVVIRKQRCLAVRSSSRSAALSPLNAATAEQIRQHLRDVRRERFLRPFLAIVSKLMFHKGNHGFFNVRVDPVVWNIPHYFEVVKHPMDLAIVKNKCLNLEYATADECADEIRLVFNNACLFNPPGHIVHESAAMLLREFEADYAKYKTKAEAMAKRRDEHSCPFCLDNVCGICNEKCINFEPPFVMCSGACRQRIKRHAVYYKTPDGQYHCPALKRRPYTKDFTRALGFDEEIEEKVFDYLTRVDIDAVDASTTSSFVKSQDLQSCDLSRFMQKWVEQHLENLGEHEAAQSIVVKVVSSIKSSCHVSSVVREHFRSATQEYPQTIDYTSKVIFVFQMINGVEVCIFSMYVQEYDKHCQLPANRNRTYIAYLDSLVYMRPRHKNPGKERLLQWYLSMAKKAKELGVVFACDDLYTREFELLEETLDTQLPPHFDGDYWPSEAERLAASPPKRGRKDANTASACSAKFRKRVSESVKSACESLFVIALQPTCAACKQLIVNAAYWRATNVDAYYCSKCLGAVADAIVTAAGQEAVLTEVSPANFAEACSRNKMEEAEMPCPFLDYRPNMLKNCEEHHYQFDSFRRAKYSTMMLVYQISSAQRSAQ